VNVRRFLTISLLTVCLNSGIARAANVLLPANSQSIAVQKRTLAASAGQGWRMNSWGKPSPVFSITQVQGNYGAGSVAQRFLLSANGGGGAHLIYPYTFSFGETYEATVYLRADRPTPVTVTLRQDVKNYDSFASQTLQVSTAWTQFTIRGTYLHHDTGIGSIRIIPHDFGTAIYVGQMTLSQVQQNLLAPLSQHTAIPNTFFGIVVNRLGVHTNWPGMNTEVLRMWDTTTKWSDVEPARGQWNFKRSDYYVDYATKNGAQILFTLGQTPPWAASDTTVKCAYAVGCSPPRDENDWRLYVRAMAQRYGSRIKYWELWNEPNYAGFWTGTPEQLVDLANIAQQELRAVNPNAVLIGPCATISGIQFLDRFLAAGGAKFLNGISFHGYCNTDPETLADTINAFATVMQEHGVGTLPLWNTEGAAVCDDQTPACATTMSPADLDSLGPRALSIMAAKGLANFDYYNWEARSLAPLSNLDYRTLTSAGTAYNVTTEWLKGGAVFDAYNFNDVYVVRMHSGSGDKTILWSTDDQSDVQIPSSWKCTTLTTLQGAKQAISSSRQLRIGHQPVLLQ
jgi:hypothetical protein